MHKAVISMLVRRRTTHCSLYQESEVMTNEEEKRLECELQGCTIPSFFNYPNEASTQVRV